MITLSQAVRRLGRPSLPLPAFAVSSFGSAIRQTRVADFSPEQVAFLTFGRGLDTTRMRTELKFEPKFTTAEAFADFAESVAPGLVSAERVRATETALVGALSRSSSTNGGGAPWVTPRSSRSAPAAAPVAAPGAARPPRAAATSRPAPAAALGGPRAAPERARARPEEGRRRRRRVASTARSRAPAENDDREDDRGGGDVGRARRRPPSPSRGRSPPRAPATTEHRHPGRGIPPLEWLSAFTSAAKEIFGENWEPRLAEFLAFLRRRLTGDFSVDEYGFDREVTQQFLVDGAAPDRAALVPGRGARRGEHPGRRAARWWCPTTPARCPIDGLMTAVSIHDHTGRFLRPLGADLVFKLPVVGDLARKGGATLACNEDAERMLGGGELVGVWPEGFKGIGKPFSERYKLQRFGRGGFVSAAIRAGVPIIPTSVVGAEEIYPLVGNIPSLGPAAGRAVHPDHAAVPAGSARSA